MATPKGFILQRGISPIDGNPFVVILTLKTSNRKTGKMPQVWILREDVNPVEAIATGADYSICGNCPHRRRQVWDAKRKQFKWIRSCYVNPGQAPLSIWKAYKRGVYKEDLTVEQGEKYLKGKRIRFGAYGDPALIDPVVFWAVAGAADGHTAYTHQWRDPWAQWARGAMQASCDGLADYLEASAHGWKTFRVTPKGEAGSQGKQCPATVQNSQAQCVTCALCDGDKADIWVEAHGTGAAHVK